MALQRLNSRYPNSGGYFKEQVAKMRHTGKGAQHLEGWLGTVRLLQPWPAPAHGTRAAARNTRN